MALKDLITDASKMDESAIEGVIANFVRYDPAKGRIIFTPEGATLSNENKVLVYLTAVAGWSFVSDTPPEKSTKPSDLEDLGIPGGTLRPILKKLKDSHLLANDSGHYTIQSANLAYIRSYVEGETKPNSRKSKSKAKNSDEGQPPKKDGVQARKSNASKGGGSASEAFDGLVAERFFEAPRTLKDLKEKLEELGLIFPQSALSGLVLKAVRAKVLQREKIESNGRKVWAYSNHE